MKILVTGAAGFIGFHTCKQLLERGDDGSALEGLDTTRRQSANAIDREIWKPSGLGTSNRPDNLIHRDDREVGQPIQSRRPHRRVDIPQRDSRYLCPLGRFSLQQSRKRRQPHQRHRIPPKDPQRLLQPDPGRHRRQA